MTAHEMRRLRAFYKTLLRFDKIFGPEEGTHIQSPSVVVFFDEVARFRSDFPNLLQPAEAFSFYSYRNNQGDWYTVPGIRAFLATALSTVEAELDQDESSLIFETREFTFIADTGLRLILKRDYLEVQRAFIAKCWKSVIILCGSAIEAILTDLLLKNAAQAQTSVKAPKGADFTRWGLADLIEVAVDLDLVSAGVHKLSHSVRDYRNLIHPGNEVRNKLTFDAEEAKIALEILHILHRDLS